MTLSYSWNPWHGCVKISPGCQNCYVYRMDERHGRNARIIKKTAAFDLPLRRTRTGSYKLQSGGVVYTCFTSDFFLQQADAFRAQAWDIIRQRKDLFFLIVTKRIHRFNSCLPDDWQEGYDNVEICCTVENQAMADYRLPLYLGCPIKHKSIICEPLLERIDLSNYLTEQIAQVIAGGESGQNARICDFSWVESLSAQCRAKQVAFHFKQTGAFFRKDGKLYHIPRALQASQAFKANIDVRF